MGVERFSFHHERHITKIWVVYHLGDPINEATFAFGLKVPLGTGVSVQLVDIL